jgi:hypothetical protein
MNGAIGHQKMAVGVGDGYSTAVVFLCANCGSTYRAVQTLAQSKQRGAFDCSECKAEVHSWNGSYDYIGWTSISPAPIRPKRIRKTGPQRTSPKWTKDDDGQLLKMAMADMTAADIAHALKRTPGSIYSRLQRLNRRKQQN